MEVSARVNHNRQGAENTEDQMSLKPSYWPTGISSGSSLERIDTRQHNSSEPNPSDDVPGLGRSEWTTASQAQGPFNAEGSEDVEGRTSQDKQGASRERTHERALGAKRFEGRQSGRSWERYEP